jgi:hypothetical protein
MRRTGVSAATVVGVVLVAVLLLAACGGSADSGIPSDTRAGGTELYTTGVYTEQGGDKFVVASGGELEVRSGGTLDLQSGATVDGSAGIDLDGADLTIDADGDSVLDENTDDAIRLTLGAASGKFSVLTGNAYVGNGTATTAKNGEDLYVEGNSEFDSQARFDGAVGFNSTITSTLVNAAGGSANPFDWTGTAGIMNGSDDLTILDINLTNANHTSTANTVQAIDIAGMTADADATETGIVIGAGWDYGLDLDGNVVVVGADGGVTLDETSDDVVALTTGAGAGKLNVLTGNLAVGNGSPGVSLNGEDAYIEGTLEVDGAVALDNTLKVTGAVNSLIDATAITTHTIYTAADSNTYVVFKNESTYKVTATLPAAAAGLNFCFYNYEGDDVEVDAPTGDQIHHYTSATDEEVDNSTAGDWICLVALDGTDWFAYSIEGTWSDD